MVVIAFIALLIGVLMPALARVGHLAFKMTCGTNLSGIGKAILIYANGYEDELPRAAARGTTRGMMPAQSWKKATDRRLASALGTDGSGDTTTMNSCSYLLVKYAEVTPK